jgi:beta-phosphoglucomutase-like phosphatase (HAD superfamily)
MAVADKKKSEGGEQAGWVLLSLEGLVVPLRQTAHDILKSALTENGLPFTESFFAHCPETASPEPLIAAVNQNFKAGAAAQKKIAEALRSGFDNFWSAPRTVAGFDALLKSILARDLHIVAITNLGADVAEAVMARAGLRDASALLLTFEKNEKPFPDPSSWLRAVKQSGAHPLDCVALVSSGPGCKSALAAGLRSVAVPDGLTSWQDYSGADYVADSLQDSAIVDHLVPV